MTLFFGNHKGAIAKPELLKKLINKVSSTDTAFQFLCQVSNQFWG
jgi:hypothetical protein